MVYYHFEWDTTKAAANQGKHGLAFEDAARVFRDPFALTLYDEEHSGRGEQRWVTLGKLADDRLVVVIHTFEEVSHSEMRVRIISARRATRNERRTYEERT